MLVVNPDKQVVGRGSERPVRHMRKLVARRDDAVASGAKVVN